MKKILFAVLFISAVLKNYAQDAYTVKIKLTDLGNYTLGMFYAEDGKSVIDTTPVSENGYVVFTGRVKSPVFASIVVRNHPKLKVMNGKAIIPGPSLSLVLSNELIEVNGDVATIYMATIKGGRTNEEYASTKNKVAPLTHESWLLMKKTYEEYQPMNDTVNIKIASAKRLSNFKMIRELNEQFMQSYPSSLMSVYLLTQQINELSIEQLEKKFSLLTDEWKNTAYADRIKNKINGLSATATGMAAINFSKNDINGQRISLSDYKGKYVLLDFWGSWCKPCRITHPHMKDIYAKYKRKGLEIVGVASETGDDLLKNKKLWKDAVKEDDIHWVHVLNNEDIDRFDVVKSYGVTAFPTKLLLDKEGKILVRWVGAQSEELDKKLKELFGE